MNHICPFCLNSVMSSPNSAKGSETDKLWHFVPVADYLECLERSYPDQKCTVQRHLQNNNKKSTTHSHFKANCCLMLDPHRASAADWISFEKHCDGPPNHNVFQVKSNASIDADAQCGYILKVDLYLTVLIEFILGQNAKNNRVNNAKTQSFDYSFGYLSMAPMLD